MESPVALTGERGQAVMLYAVLVPLTVLFALGVFDLMVTTARLMHTGASAELAAHAGAQQVRLLPDGRLRVDHPEAEQAAAALFLAQAPEEALLAGVECGLRRGRPSCRVSAAVRTPGYLLPARWLQVQADGMLAYGVTRDDQ